MGTAARSSPLPRAEELRRTADNQAVATLMRQVAPGPTTTPVDESLIRVLAVPVYGTLGTSRSMTTLRKGVGVRLDVPAPSDRIRISTGLKPYLWALGLTWVLPAVLVLVGWVVLSLTEDAPTCQHPTMSCISIEPADGMLMLAMMFLMPVCAVAGMLAVTVIAVRKAARRRRAT